jgi:hypothetical protein
MPKLTAQQADLAGVHHLVVSAPEKREQLRLRVGMGMRHRLIQVTFLHCRQFPQDLLVHSIECRP